MFARPAAKPMRNLLLLLAASSLASSAFAAPPNASAQLFAERTALLAGDAKCHVLAANARTALIATTGQARYAALRDGWTADALTGVAARATNAGAGRGCTDPLLLTAAKSATAGYQGWAGFQAMTFKGADRTWAARRTPDPAGWMLSQALGANAQFGVLMIDGKERLALMLPPGAAASTTIYFRNTATAPNPILGVPGLAVQPGLAGRATPRSMATARLPSARTIDRRDKQPERLMFTFPATVLSDIAALDPREAVEIELAQPSGKPTKLYLEVGDLAVARAFLAAKR